MRNRTRFFALAASLLLLTAPAAQACDELMGGMLGCSQTQVVQASIEETCHEAGDKALMDCCDARSIAQPEQSARVEADTSLSSLEAPLSLPTETLAAAQHPAAADSKSPRWREPARYALFSSYII